MFLYTSVFNFFYSGVPFLILSIIIVYSKPRKYTRLIRSFFSAFFELASSMFIGNVISNPNQALNLIISLGLMRNS